MNEKKGLSLNHKKWKILTDSGFVDFSGISEMGIKKLYRVTFTDKTHIDITSNHVFFQYPTFNEIKTEDLYIGIELVGVSKKTVAKKEYICEEMTYDIINTTTHTFFANDVLVHNCKFISSDALLIDSTTLGTLESFIKEAIYENKDAKFWELPISGETYLIAVDPATGTMQDFSVIEVFHFPSLRQVAEFRSNTMDSNAVYASLKRIIQYFEKHNCEIYFSIENNGVGEGIIALYHNDEKVPNNALFISEDGAKRYGMTTTNKTKMRACLDFKTLIEKGQMIIHSKIFLTEMKTFIRKGVSYEAQKGSTDDCISAGLILTRLLSEMTTYDQNAFEKMYSYNDSDDDYDDDDDDFEPDAIVF